MGKLDLVGQRFGRLIVLESIGIKNRQQVWLCQCDCGKQTNVLTGKLRSGYTKSCGCAKGHRAEDLSGKRFGYMTVVSRADNQMFVDKNGESHIHTMWNCVCDCGNTKACRGSHLKSGRIISCGCVGFQHLQESLFKHGGTRTRLYYVWCDMKNRCANKNVRSYKDYGGRGISVCDEWKNDFSAFQDWAFANGYDPSASYGECTIDRIDVNGNYEPSNCRFVDMKVQSNNRRKRVKADD